MQLATGAVAGVHLSAFANSDAAVRSMLSGHWLELPDTTLRSVLPAPLPRGNPKAIVTAWNGGAVDTLRSRLLIWGGGHADYFGNELYALDLTTQKVSRLTDPSPAASSADCKEALPDGTPTARHTYGGMAYLPGDDALWITNGSLSPCGFAGTDSWMFRFADRRWERVAENNPVRGYGVMAAYDPATGWIYVKDRVDFYAYASRSRSFRKLNSREQPVDYHLSAAIDTKRRLFVMVGDGVQMIDLRTYEMTRPRTDGAPALITGRQSPGIAYDPIGDRIVVWHGGDDVFALDMDGRRWSQVAVSKGPSVAAPQQGTFGRWGYVPQLRVFALVNDIDQNAWLFKP
jgi:hypothetical protein